VSPSVPPPASCTAPSAQGNEDKSSAGSRSSARSCGKQDGNCAAGYREEPDSRQQNLVTLGTAKRPSCALEQLPGHLGFK
jgi:hypothetical protein